MDIAAQKCKSSLFNIYIVIDLQAKLLSESGSIKTTLKKKV